MKQLLQWVLIGLPVVILLSCGKKQKSYLAADTRELQLKQGEVITCGPPDREFGKVVFENSCRKEAEDFNLAMALLHSFVYDEAEKVFARILAKEPACAMAYWGVAMSNFHPLWTPPSEAELKKGSRILEIARKIAQKSTREGDYIEAIASFYDDWEKTDHATRCLRFEKAMQKLSFQYPDDKEAAILYALALNAAVDPADKSFQKQKKAGTILHALYPNQPDHPGIVHYIIHTYDSPELAKLALPAARKYASVAPSSAHALHMPSHIFTRLGLWDECIQSNLASVSSAQCYAEAAGMKGHWDEELHGLDYLMYAYLQKGDNQLAKQQWDYLKTIKEVQPVNFKVAYAFAAIPARYVLENKLWPEAAQLPVHPVPFPWQKFPWQKAIIHFARILGFAQTGALDSAKAELIEIQRLEHELVNQKDAYKANQVRIQATAAEAWIKWKEGKKEEALQLMNQAADWEDQTEKHPVTPGEVIPARELLADMYLQMSQPDQALTTFEQVLQKHPFRFNSLYGAGQAAAKTGNIEKTTLYYRQLISIVNPVTSSRPELVTVKHFLKKHE